MPKGSETRSPQAGPRNTMHSIFKINRAKPLSPLLLPPRSRIPPLPCPSHFLRSLSTALYTPSVQSPTVHITRGTYLPWRILPPPLRMPLIQSPDQIPVSLEPRKQAWIRLLQRHDGGIDHTRRQQQPFLAVAMHVFRVHCAEGCVYWLVGLG